jgi:hypothetical protein
VEQKLATRRVQVHAHIEPVVRAELLIIAKANDRSLAGEIRQATKRKPEHPTKEPEPDAYPYPIGVMMPRGWKPERAVSYITIRENFSVAPRMFVKGQVVRGDDPIVAKLIYSTPAAWLTVVWKEN